MLLYQPNCLTKLPEFKDNPTKVDFTLMELSGAGEVSPLHGVIQESRLSPSGVSTLLASLGHTGRRVVFGHTLNTF